MYGLLLTEPNISWLIINKLIQKNISLNASNQSINHMISPSSDTTLTLKVETLKDGQTLSQMQN